MSAVGRKGAGSGLADRQGRRPRRASRRWASWYALQGSTAASPSAMGTPRRSPAPMPSRSAEGLPLSRPRPAATRPKLKMAARSVMTLTSRLEARLEAGAGGCSDGLTKPKTRPNPRPVGTTRASTAPATTSSPVMESADTARRNASDSVTANRVRAPIRTAPIRNRCRNNRSRRRTRRDGRRSAARPTRLNPTAMVLVVPAATRSRCRRRDPPGSRCSGRTISAQ